MRPGCWHHLQLTGLLAIDCGPSNGYDPFHTSLQIVFLLIQFFFNHKSVDFIVGNHAVRLSLSLFLSLSLSLAEKILMK